MRLVLDTDVMVAALRSNQGSSRQLLLAALELRFEMLVSVPLMLEYEAVLMRPEQSAHHHWSGKQASGILAELASVLVPVPMRFSWRPQLVDPADEMVLETAINGGADHLVTFNVRHFRNAAARFGIRVQRPGEAWRILNRGNYETQ